MTLFKRILVPTDLSPRGNAPLAPALHLAKATGASLHLFHAITPDTIGSGAEFPTPDDIMQAEKSADDIFAELETKHGNGPLKVKTAVERSLSASDSIVDYAANTDVDLIAIATHGRRGPSRLLFGSVAEEVARKATCSVLTVKPRKDDDQAPADDDSEMEPCIVVGTDFSASARTAAQTAAQLAVLLQANLHLIHVVEEPKYTGASIDFTVPTVDYEARMREGRDSLDRLLKTIEMPKGRISTEVLRGDTPGTLIKAANYHQATLLAVGSRGLTGFSHLLLGSNTDRIVRKSRCPVLVVRRDTSEEA